jgi:hypothetical protein
MPTATATGGSLTPAAPRSPTGEGLPARLLPPLPRLPTLRCVPRAPRCSPCRDITSPMGLLMKVEWHYRWAVQTSVGITVAAHCGVQGPDLSRSGEAGMGGPWEAWRTARQGSHLRDMPLSPLPPVAPSPSPIPCPPQLADSFVF